MRTASLIVVSLLAAVVGACDSVSPTAPAGATLIISANPNRIASSGTSRITVIARKADGTPVNRGTLVFLTTNLGQLISSAPTDDVGVVETNLVGNNAVGVATVQASVSGLVEASVDVQIGILGASITLQSTPSQIPQTGGTLGLIALVRDDLGGPLEGATVNFSTAVGVLDSGGRVVETDATGTAIDRLTAGPGELEVAPGEDFEVTVETAGPDGGIVADTTRISILRPPRAIFDVTVDNLRVVFEDQSERNPTSWEWDFGDGNSSLSRNPVHDYGAAGVYVVTLVVRNSIGQDELSRSIQVGVSP